MNKKMNNFTFLIILLVFANIVSCIRKKPFLKLQKVSRNPSIFFEYECAEELEPPENSYPFEEFEHSSLIKTDQVLVHLIPHSHMDIAWLRTFDEYYTENVKSIYDSVFQELINDPNKKFVIVEIAFFSRWWLDLSFKRHNLFKKLFHNGQIEFLNGGWVMNDEATSYYEDIIDQLTLGHQFLKEILNITAKVGWQIDTFGHSSTQASIFSDMGFNGVFLGRIDHDDKNNRLAKKQMEFYWKPSKNKKGLFAAVTYFQYKAPKEICHDSSCSLDVKYDDNEIDQENIKSLVTYFHNMALHYKQNILLHTLGDDFAFHDALKYFSIADKLINTVNKHPEWGVKIIYSTPSEYLKSIEKAKNKYEVKHDDFFPYSDYKDGYWSGFYVSRASLKLFAIECGRFLQSVRTLFTLSQLIGDYKDMREEMGKNIFELEKKVAMVQHHDAITGTSPQRISDNFILMLSNSLSRVKKTLFNFLKIKHQKEINEQLRTYYMCNWNQTAFECDELYSTFTKSKPILLSLYNPGFKKKQILKLKIPNYPVKVIDSYNKEIQTDIICSDPNDINDCCLYFFVEMETISFNYFKILPDDSKVNQIIQGLPIEFSKVEEVEYSIKDRGIRMNKDLSNFIFFNENGEFPFQLNYNYYQSHQERTWYMDQLSGLYIFRPENNTSQQIYAIPVDSKLFMGENLIQITIQYNHVTTDIRIYGKIDDFNSTVEVESYLQPVQMYDNRGKEITLNIQTKIENNDEFYTDSNGLEMIQRKLNYRPTWNFSKTDDPIASNYYPITKMISIKDSEKKFTVVTDRAQGGSSLKEGEIEIMIQRRLMGCDCKGVGEALNETEPGSGEGIKLRMKHYLIFSGPEENIERKIQYRLDTSPLIIFANSDSETFDELTQIENFEITNYFEYDDIVKFYLSDQGFKQDKFLVRFMNNDDKLSHKFKINSDLEYDEMRLNGVEKIQENYEEFLWICDECKQFDFYYKENNGKNGDYFTIKPLEIRTFLIKKKGINKFLWKN